MKRYTIITNGDWARISHFRPDYRYGKHPAGELTFRRGDQHDLWLLRHHVAQLRGAGYIRG